MGTDRVFLGTRVSAEFKEKLEALHLKDGRLHERTRKRESFSMYVERLLYDSYLERKRLVDIDRKNLEWEDDEFE
jgi:hypothetical protein